MNFPKVTLKNGVTVANLGSPHQFLFDDGSVLEAANKTLIEMSSFRYQEELLDGIKGTIDVKLTPMMTASAAELLWMADNDDTIDIVIVPRPLLDAIKSSGIMAKKARGIKLSDRVTKVCRSDMFCV